MSGSPRKIAELLVGWFEGAKRVMPWRGVRDAYAIWVSETMLQQTQVATVVPYYLRFMARFPTVGALAGAELSEVLALWAGLGYYRRAKHLHMGARVVVERFGGKVPGSVEGLMELPGVGRYTAGAVGSIAFGLAAAVVDGNVVRVLARVYGYAGVEREFYWERAGEIVRGAPWGADKVTRWQGDKVTGGGASDAGGARRYGDVNQAMMELGATVCVPAGPRCGACPLRGVCVARREGRQGELPVKGVRRKVPVVRRRAVVVLRQRGGKDEVLMMERPGGGLWEHMWEFPTVGEGEDLGKALGMKLSGVKRCGEVRHVLTHRVMEYEVWVGEVKGGARVKCVACAGEGYVAVKWVGWLLAKRHELPMAKVVGKIAELAEAVLG